MSVPEIVRVAEVHGLDVGFVYNASVGFMQGHFHAADEDIAREDREPDRPKAR